MDALIHILKHTLLISAFVLTMMLVIEYVNVLTSGSWQARLAGYRWGQYIIAAFLGILPGCLGPFSVIAMYSHGMVSVGAVVTTMIATSGDESFVMLAIIPRQAMQLMAVLFITGIAVGALTDIFLKRRGNTGINQCEDLKIHESEICEFFPREQILQQWKQCSATRGIMVVVLTIFLLGIIFGQLGPPEWNWIRVTLILVSGISLFIVGTVPDHFLEEHLWGHVVKKHAPRIFLWTLGAFIAMHVLTEQLHLTESLQKGKWLILLLACLTGLIPESGPHLVFVTLYYEGALPISILLANSIVQDGHGMLPMIAYSKKNFIGIKAVKLLAGLLIGAIAMAMGF